MSMDPSPHRQSYSHRSEVPAMAHPEPGWKVQVDEPVVDIYKNMDLSSHRQSYPPRSEVPAMVHPETDWNVQVDQPVEDVCKSMDYNPHLPSCPLVDEIPAMVHPEPENVVLLDVPIPLWTSVTGGGIFPGNAVRVAGLVPWGAQRFEINLCQYQGGDIALHINPRFNDQAIVFNSRFGGDWGPEERTDLRLRHGENFDLLVQCTASAYIVTLNGIHLKNYQHRNAPGACTSMLNIEGSIQVQSVNINPQGPVICPPAGGYPANPGGGFMPPGMPYVPPTGGFPAPSSRQPVYNPTMPFIYPLYGGVMPGNIIRIDAMPTRHANRCIVNLMCGGNRHNTPDLGLHVSCRFDQNTIVLNTRERNSYGTEIRGPYFPLRHGASFRLEIIVEPHGYLVTVDGVPVGTMPHRVHPMARVDHLEVEGDMNISSITF